MRDALIIISIEQRQQKENKSWELANPEKPERKLMAYGKIFIHLILSLLTYDVLNLLLRRVETHTAEFW